MNFNDCLDFLNELHLNNNKSSLTRFKQKLHELNCYPNSPNIFTVAGTNGKGTTCVTLESILLAAGYKTGCYLSPHLLSVTERFRINGQIISEQEFCTAFVKAKIAYQDEQVGWFEFASLVAMLIFVKQELDFLILEVGIGGKQDVMNAMDADVAIITSIDLDHTEILGNTRELIGTEKAGIFRAYKPAICADPNPPLTVINKAQEIAVDLILSERDYFYIEESSGWYWYNQSIKSPLLPYPHFPVANAAAAIAALHSFFKYISWDNISEGIKNAFLPGRFQIMRQSPLIICDVAHNPHAARHLAHQLKRQRCDGKTYAIVSMQTKKDILNTLAAMLKVIDKWYISELDGRDTPSTASFVNIAQDFLLNAAAEVVVSSSVSHSLEAILQIAQAADRIIIFGSFLTIEKYLRTACLAL